MSATQIGGNDERAAAVRAARLAFADIQRAFGAESKHAAQALALLVELLRECRRFREAERFGKQLATMYVGIYGGANANSIAALCCLSNIQQALGKNGDALRSIELAEEFHDRLADRDPGFLALSEAVKKKLGGTAADTE